MAIGAGVLLFAVPDPRALLLSLSHRYWLPGEFVDGPIASTACEESPATAATGTAINLVDASELLGPPMGSKTFALAAADLNGDEIDDILIGTHESNPYLLVSSGASAGYRFSNRSASLFTQAVQHDRHGYTLADLDNDGDLDIAIAGGGTDGVGAGATNILLRNASVGDRLLFKRETMPESFALKAMRSRALLPLASADGSAVDLYATTLQRSGHPNVLLQNMQSVDGIEFQRAEAQPFPHSLEDHGRGVIADLDDDGRNDYLVIDNTRLVIHWNPKSDRPADTLSTSAFSTRVADFNNDGLLDIVVGALSRPTRSDRISYDSRQLVFVAWENGRNDTNAIAFKTAGATLGVDLEQVIPRTISTRSRNASAIYLGSRTADPGARRFVVSREQALGEPASFEKAGTYIWYAATTAEWNMRWVFHPGLDVFKGAVQADGISDVRKLHFYEHEVASTRDQVLLNRGGGRFSREQVDGLEHSAITAGITVADFDNNGWLDILAVRHGEQGSCNRDLLLLANQAESRFTASSIPLRAQDKLYRADLVVHGFFNEDDKPDAVLTNGYGQLPGTGGVPRLLLNRTDNKHSALRVQLQGTTANRFAIGARLSLRDAANTLLGYRVQGLNSNIAQDSQWQHFGLGDSAAPYQLEVDWPDGSSSQHSFGEAGRVLVKQP